uniref:Uncharacterized protein n=1 Tax=Tanacetum cinerariifolium TaxID=118510 RepID=A0A6L2NBE2_TANCI|nr:hypothetical protein [Tanacetum cinerariifolium]
MNTKAQKSALDNALVAPENQRVIGPVIYIHQFWATVNKHNASYRFKINNKRFSVNVEVFREILNICLRTSSQEFVEPLSEEEALSFICEHSYSGEIKYITDVIIDHLHQSSTNFFVESLLGTMRFVSRHEDTQVYDVILPKLMMNQAMLDSVAYKTYYAIASGKEPPKSKKPKRKSDSAILSEGTPSKKKPTKAKKDVPSTKKPTTKLKPTKKKALGKADRGKSLNIFSEVALSKAVQLKEVTKQSNKDFYISHASSSGDGTDFQSGVPDEKQCKISDTNKGTGTKPGFLDVPKYDSESDKESWGDSREEDDDDEDDTKDDEDNDDGDDNDSDHERTELDIDKNHNLNQFNEEHEEDEEENVNEFTDKEDNNKNKEELDNGEELHKYVNVNLRKKDIEMTDADQSGEDQHNVYQESGFEQEEKDAHVTLTIVHDRQNTKGPIQSSSVSSDFIEKLLNFENVFPADNDIASLMDTTVCNEDPSDFVSIFRFNDKVTNLERDLSEMKQVDRYAQAISLIPAIIDRYMDNKLGEAIHKAIQSHNTECREEAQAKKQNLRLATPLIERNVTKSLEAYVLVKSSSQPKSTYEADASLLEYDLTKILLNKMEEIKSHLRDRGTKRRKSSKEAESQKDSRSKEGKSSRSSKDTSHSHHKSSDKSTHAEELSHTIDDSKVQKNQKFDTGKSYPFDLHKPLLLILDHRGRQFIPQDYFINNDLQYLKGGSLSRQYSTSVTKTKAATYEIKWIEDMDPNLWIARLKIIKRHDYDHLDEIEVRREAQQLYTFKEGNFPRLRLQDIEDILLLLVQQKLTNLMIDEQYDLNVALRMFTRRFVIQRWVEDLQLGIKSYQKKLNLTKPNTFRKDLKKRTIYTAYSDPQGVIYVDQNNKNSLMCTDKLHKFSDGTLDSVRTALHDITLGIRMEYLPKKKWSSLDKRRARVMIHNINKLLFERRLMRNLEKFVGGRIRE